ncbi:hypothetical protein TanjilG_04863 [Lupinus angustifolius]|uniref:Uncharacterized protein n=1 Tax=Lupinus angustifolius TaxID=3871 RepID=A0A4P1QS58_LUPAN|nr:hypothetical protein TanjilG_04863 [Lupinus angustifolius]
MDRTSQRSSDSPTRDPKVLSIECLRGSYKADEWTHDMLQTGDIVEEIRIGTFTNSIIRSIKDPNYVLDFLDRYETEYFSMNDSPDRYNLFKRCFRVLEILGSSSSTIS